jgi:hypothetical protein
MPRQAGCAGTGGARPCRIHVKALSKTGPERLPDPGCRHRPRKVYSALGQPAQAGGASFAEAGQDGASFLSVPSREPSRPFPLPA